MGEVRVQDEQGNVHVFPDGSTPEMISKAMNLKPPDSTPAPNYNPSWKEEKQGLKDLAVNIPMGALKSLGQTLTSGNGLPTTSIPVNSDQQEGIRLARENLQPALKPEGEVQHIGAGLEQAGEMALTGGPLKSGMGALAGKLPFLGKAAAPGARVAAEALNTAGNATMHNQDPNTAALVGAGGGALSEMMPALIPWLRNSAQKQYSKVLNPTTVRNKNITQDVVPQLLDRNVISTESGLLKKSGKNVDQLGQDITSAVGNVPSSVTPDTQKVIDSLEKYKQGNMVNGVAVNSSAVQHASDLQDMIKQLGPNVSYQSLNKARQILDKGVAQAGGYAGKTLSEGSMIDAQREAANAIRAELSRQSPDIAKINAEFHFWKGVQDVTQATAERRTGQAGGLIRNSLPFLGSAAGLAHGGMTTTGGLEAAGTTALMLALDKGVKSGLFRTTAAVAKARLADLIASGKTQAAMSFLTGLGSSEASQSQPPPGRLENMLQAVRSQQ